MNEELKKEAHELVWVHADEVDVLLDRATLAERKRCAEQIKTDIIFFVANEKPKVPRDPVKLIWQVADWLSDLIAKGESL